MHVQASCWPKMCTITQTTSTAWCGYSGSVTMNHESSMTKGGVTCHDEPLLVFHGDQKPSTCVPWWRTPRVFHEGRELHKCSFMKKNSTCVPWWQRTPYVFHNCKDLYVCHKKIKASVYVTWWQTCVIVMTIKYHVCGLMATILARMLLLTWWQKPAPKSSNDRAACACMKIVEQ